MHICIHNYKQVFKRVKVAALGAKFMVWTQHRANNQERLGCSMNTNAGAFHHNVATWDSWEMLHSKICCWRSNTNICLEWLTFITNISIFGTTQDCGTAPGGGDWHGTVVVSGKWKGWNDYESTIAAWISGARNLTSQVPKPARFAKHWLHSHCWHHMCVFYVCASQEC